MRDPCRRPPKGPRRGGETPRSKRPEEEDKDSRTTVATLMAIVCRKK